MIGLGQRSFLVDWIRRVLPEFSFEDLWKLTEKFEEYDRRKYIAMLYNANYEQLKKELNILMRYL